KGFVLSENGMNLSKRITDRYDKIAQETQIITSTLLKHSKTYKGVNKIIQINVLEKLQPKLLSDNEPHVNIVNRLNDIILKMTFDINTVTNTFQSLTVRDDTPMRGGSDDNSFKLKLSKNRAEVDLLLKDIDNKEISKIKNLQKELYNSMLKLKDPAQVKVLGDTTFESIFNRLYNKYIEDRTINDIDDYTASKQLVDTLEENNLLPKKVLKVDLRDKIVFIFTTLFIRLIALYLIEKMVDKKTIVRLDIAVFGFLTIFTLLFIVLIITVNADTYKLRIIYNYVILHSDPTNIFTYTALLWFFGMGVYFVMYNINNNTLNIAASDEERSKLKYKLQVITMVIWLYVTIAIIAM
ncbi:MAG: hypothetical protein ACO3UU_09420, partial [Minisyncoccia bacterium]